MSPNYALLSQFCMKLVKFGPNLAIRICFTKNGGNLAKNGPLATEIGLKNGHPPPHPTPHQNHYRVRYDKLSDRTHATKTTNENVDCFMPLALIFSPDISGYLYSRQPIVSPPCPSQKHFTLQPPPPPLNHQTLNQRI